MRTTTPELNAEHHALQMLVLQCTLQTDTNLTRLTILGGANFAFSFGHVRSKAPMEFADGFHDETAIGVSRVSSHWPGDIRHWRSIADNSGRWREPLDSIRARRDQYHRLELGICDLYHQRMRLALVDSTQANARDGNDPQRDHNSVGLGILAALFASI